MVSINEDQIRALLILLDNLKYSEVENAEVFKLCPKSQIDEIHAELRKFYYEKFLSSESKEAANKWLERFSFKFDDWQEERIRNRIDSWGLSKNEYYKGFNDSELEELARGLIRPYDDNTEEVVKLVQYIKDRLNR